MSVRQKPKSKIATITKSMGLWMNQELGAKPYVGAKETKGKVGAFKEYVPLKDNEGNLLRPEDIGFVYIPEAQSIQDVTAYDAANAKKNLDYVTVFNNGVKPIYEPNGKFPIALDYNNKRYAKKISLHTMEELPKHAGCDGMISCILMGASGSGKTCYAHQICDATFHNMIAGNNHISFRNDMLETHEDSSVDARRTYNKQSRMRMMNDYIWPEPTGQNEEVLPLYFYVSYKEDKDCIRNVILKIQDMDGGICQKLSYTNKELHNNSFIIAIGADELSAEINHSAVYETVMDRFLTNINLIHDIGDDFHVTVLITKCDLLLNEYDELRTSIKNTICQERRALRQVTHRGGFDEEAFFEKEEIIKAFLQDKAPNFFNSITNVIREENLSFAMIASVGEDTTTEDNCFTKYEPFSIDEPIVRLLYEYGIYPMKQKIPDIDLYEQELFDYDVKPRFNALGWNKFMAALSDMAKQVAKGGQFF